MKLQLFILLAILISVIMSCATEKTNQLEGTWELVSGKYILPDTTINRPESNYERTIKIINKTHFATIKQDTSKDESFMFNAGKYILNKNTYTENLEFFSHSYLIGSSLSFEIKIEGDHITMSGPIKKIGEDETEWEVYEVYKKIR